MLKGVSKDAESVKEEFLDEGRALLMEAAALDVRQEESDLVVTAMKNLGPQWKAVKQEYLLRPTETTTFDAMEEGRHWRA